MRAINNIAALVLFAVLSTPLVAAGPEGSGDAAADDVTVSRDIPSESCNWWVSPECRTFPLPPEASRTGVVITVDTSANRAHLFRDGELVMTAPAATGTNTELRKGNRRWYFYTPKGRHIVQRKVVNPIWTKPDWAFVEEGKPIPPANHPSRKVKGVLGRYALDLGEGILIHGTNDPSSIGRKASHGCIRLSDKELRQVFLAAEVGTEVHIF